MSQDLLYAFEIMGKGMLNIFLVMIILMIVVTILSKVTEEKDKDNEEN